METLNPFLVYSAYVIVGIASNVLSLTILKKEGFFNYKNPMSESKTNPSGMLGHFYFNALLCAVSGMVGFAIARQHQAAPIWQLAASNLGMVATILIVTAFIKKK